MEQRNMGDSVAGGKTFSGGRMDDVYGIVTHAGQGREKKKRTPTTFSPLDFLWGETLLLG
jgi:hypothetical protein